MEALSCRLLAWEVGDGPTNMAADEALVRTAAESGIASLRFYGWRPATLSLGYFQASAARHSEARLAALPFVRRPSGGAALVHDQEITYALAIPPAAMRHSGGPWMAQMHGIIAQALVASGIPRGLAPVPDGTVVARGKVLCFQQCTPGDLLCDGHKVVGSAQRKYCRALLQHGAILLGTSEHACVLPGLQELTGRRLPVDMVCAAIAHAFSQQTRWQLRPDEWTEQERAVVASLARDKYGSTEWNERR